MPFMFENLEVYQNAIDPADKTGKSGTMKTENAVFPGKHVSLTHQIDKNRNALSFRTW